MKIWKHTFQSTKRSGFTIIELLLVIGLIAVVSAGVFGMGRQFLVKNYAHNTQQQLLTALTTAQRNALSGKEASSWGVTTTGQQLIMFKGSSFASRDQAFDVVYSVPSSVQVNTEEVVFAQVTGFPDSPTTFTITAANEVSNVAVNSQGVIDAQ